MISTYYTIRLLASRWNVALRGASITDAFSHHKGEMVLATRRGEERSSLTVSVVPAHIYAFRGNASRPRRNVADVLVGAMGESIRAVRAADRDRVVHLDLQSDRRIDIQLFGSRANVLLIEDGKIIDSFLRRNTIVSRPAPVPRPAKTPPSEQEFVATASATSRPLEASIKSAFPLFDRTLVSEAVARAEGPAGHARIASAYRAARGIESELASPAARIYESVDGPVFSLIDLSYLASETCELYEDIDVAVRTFIVGSLSRDALARHRDPLLKRLETEQAKLGRSVERMREELQTASRADHYEKLGHLLMAGASSVTPGADEVEMEDIMDGHGHVHIRLDPSFSAIENAQLYYDRARRVRGARATAKSRLADSERRLEKIEQIVGALKSVTQVAGVEQLKKENADIIERSGRGEVRRPFRRIEMGGEYEVWVGRSARENDELTFGHARKYDLWMHARGVPGSHVLLRLPGREAEPPPAIVERAASIAAWFSKARGSGLVPVIVTPRKFVRKAKGAGPGKVLVEREKVVTVEPREP